MPTNLTDEERSLRASLAAHNSWGHTADRSARTAPARAAADRRFVAQALEINPGLAGKPLADAAASLRSAWYKHMAYRSAIARKTAS